MRKSWSHNHISIATVRSNRVFDLDLDFDGKNNQFDIIVFFFLRFIRSDLI